MGRKLITKKEFENHDTEKNYPWLCIHGFIVQVDDELRDKHPGGPEVIFNLAGTDATEDFEDMGHSDSAREWANRCIIGYIEGREDLANEEMLMPDKPVTLKQACVSLLVFSIVIGLCLGFSLGIYFISSGGSLP